MSTEQQRDIPFVVPNPDFGPASTMSAETSYAQAAAAPGDFAMSHQDFSNAILSPVPLDVDPQMIWSHEDQLALMGLTGLDMLEI
jgi:hypothetical protein